MHTVMILFYIGHRSISIFGNLPCLNPCKTGGRLFLIGACYQMHAHFPGNTVRCLTTNIKAMDYFLFCYIRKSTGVVYESVRQSLFMKMRQLLR